MKKKDLYNILNHKNKLSDSEVTAMEKFIEEHPYFEVGRIILLKDLIDKNSPKALEAFRDQSFFLRDKSELHEKLSLLNVPKNQGTSIDHIEKVLETKDQSEKSNQDQPALGEPTPIVDFTDDLLNELEIIGKGVKEMEMESFPETKSVTEKEQAKEELKEPSESVKSDPKSAEKEIENKEVVKKESETIQKSTKAEPDLADKVMAELAKMKAERAQVKDEHIEKKVEPKAKAKEKSKDSSKPVESKKAEPKERKASSTGNTATKSTAKKPAVKKTQTAKSTPTETDDKKSVAKKTGISRNTKKKSDTKTNVKKESSSKTEEELPEKPRDRKGEKRIIDSFIKSEIKIRPRDPDKVEKNPEDLSKPSTELPSNLISENLAKIFEKQGKTSKAISIYKELILKYPDKKSYFAAKIEKLEK